MTSEQHPEWLEKFLEFMQQAAQFEMEPCEIADAIHQGLLMVEAERYSTPESRFTFCLSGASPAALAEIRRHLTPFENGLVELVAESRTE
jgi:hypothetical protein